MQSFGNWFFNRPYLLLTLTALFWGGNAVAGKLAAGTVPPLTLTAVRWTITAVILYVMARPLIDEAWPTVRKNLPFLMMLGAIGFAGFNFALYGALNFTSAINAAIEQSAMPMVIMLLSFFIFRERVKPVQIVGAVLSILGVIVTATRGSPLDLLRLDVNVGDAIMILAILTYSVYSVLLRKKPALDWRVFMFVLATSAAIVSIPFAVGEALTGRVPEASLKTVGLFVYVIVFPSLMSQIFFLRGVEMIGANRAGLFINLVPVFAAVLAILILGERFQPFHAVGLGLVLGGIALSEIVTRRSRSV